jgi:hypothetical protein
MALIAGVSLLGVGGFAVLSSARGGLPVSEAVGPIAVIKSPAQSVETSALERQAKSDERPLTYSTVPAPDPVPVERIDTASISPPVLPPTPAVVPSLTPPQRTSAPEPITKAPELPPVLTAPKARPVPLVSTAEAAAYLSRAETALRNGDLVGARSLFNRLAEAGDPRGALGMARTYDDTEFKKVRVYGLRPDRAEAERWRARARELTNAVAKPQGGQ